MEVKKVRRRDKKRRRVRKTGRTAASQRRDQLGAYGVEHSTLPCCCATSPWPPLQQPASPSLNPSPSPSPSLTHLSQPHLDGPSAVLDGGDGGGASAAIVSRDLDDVCVGLGHT